MKVCSRCILPESYKTIRFDADSVCNYCRTYEALSPQLNDFGMLQGLLQERLDAVKGKSKYDCLVGLSGGKDSSYVALKASRDLGLRTLAVTFDNGWLTDYAKDNIARVVKALGIEHQYFRIDWDLHRVFYREMVKWFGIPCPGCSYAVGMLAHKYSIENDIPLVIHGRSRSQMFRELAPGTSDLFFPFIHQNLRPYDMPAICDNLESVATKIESFFKMNIRDKGVNQALQRELFPNISRMRNMDRAPELLGYFLYYPYDEKAIMAELENEIGWKRPQDSDLLTHNDCAVHDAVEYLYPKVFDFPALCFEASVLIREGKMTRQEALDRVERERAKNQDIVPEDSMRVLCRRLEIDQQSIPTILKRVRTKHKVLRSILRLKSIWNRKDLHLFESRHRSSIQQPGASKALSLDSNNGKQHK